MQLRIFHLLVLLLLSILPMSAQDISVADFYLDEMDLTANSHGTTVIDQNGNKCALIKIITTQTGFNFDVGVLGITKTEQHTAEIWVYVPAGVKRISISHQQLGQLRDYNFPVQIEKAKTYIMKLTTGTVQTIVTEAKVKTGWILLDSEPQGAQVYIDGDFVGSTPLNDCKRPYGTYDYRLELGNYHNSAGKIQLNAPQYEETITMVPAFGSIRVESSVSGAMVFLDGKSTNKTTPCTLEEVSSGEHMVKVLKEKYTPVEQTIIVEDGKTSAFQANTTARFANITISTLQGAYINVDGQSKGTTFCTVELMEGLHDIEASLAHHRSATKQITVVAGQSQTFQLTPTPIYGSLDVISNPRKATITIDGKSYGTTPTTIDELLEGLHNVTLTLEGYASYSQSVNIKEGESVTVNATLQNGRQVTITADKAGAVIYIDGQQVGNAPYNGSLSFGSHEMYAVAAGKQSSRQRVNVTEGNGTLAITVKFSGKEEITVNGVTFAMIPVEGGTFTMGAHSNQSSDADNDETPTHQVTLSSYYIGETEVTQGLWQAVMGSNPSNWKGDNLPVEEVSWNDCQKFIRKLNTLTGKTFRLPTEAEWEYAARGGNKSKDYKYSGSNNLDDVAWYTDNSSSKTHSVKTKQPNELGIYDMSGNVWEWCQDRFGDYSSSSQTNPTGPNSGSYRVFRGGGWFSNASYCRSSSRNLNSPDYRNYDLGLRLVLSE